MNANRRRRSKRRILIIDDEVTFTRLLKMNLESTERYLVHAENDPENALAVALKFRPDLVLMDVMMPGMDGGELANLFRATPSLARVPVIMLTATVRRDEVEGHEGYLCGFRFLAKPVSLVDLRHCLEECFDESPVSGV